jgi:hypothetical protein
LRRPRYFPRFEADGNFSAVVVIKSRLSLCSVISEAMRYDREAQNSTSVIER